MPMSSLASLHLDSRAVADALAAAAASADRGIPAVDAALEADDLLAALDALASNAPSTALDSSPAPTAAPVLPAPPVALPAPPPQAIAPLVNDEGRSAWAHLFDGDTAAATPALPPLPPDAHASCDDLSPDGHPDGGCAQLDELPSCIAAEAAAALARVIAPLHAIPAGEQQLALIPMGDGAADDAHAAVAPVPASTTGDSIAVSVGGAPVALLHLGPVIINADGSLSSVSNWGDMSEREQALTARRIAKRNDERRAALFAAGVRVSSSL